MAYNRVELQASAAQTASGNSASKSIPTGSIAVVNLNITATSGTPSLDAWLQGSDDGTTWYDLPYDQQLSSASAATDLTANTDKRNINGTSSATGTGKHVATYKHLACRYVRLSWVISGSTPSLTFESALELK